ncbi:MAG: folylpolyglutamate synthase/dihydrofolate synthase family protein [Opitutales bacterium]
MSTKAEKYLFSLRNQGSKYGIDRMQALVLALGHPEREYPVIHVAGTNGKGSVCAMLEAVLRKAGLRVGMLTSPHLVSLGERLQVNRWITPDEEIADFVDYLQPIAERLGRIDPEDHPSFFELITAMGFLLFAREQVDVAVVETGLGGRLDATNVVDPILTIVTSVAMDHVAQLGNDLASIAKEKAGILKQRVPVVIGRMPFEAKEVIVRVAENLQANVFQVETLFPHAPRDLPITNLEGTFQRWNAGVTLLATQVLEKRFGLKEPFVRDALQGVDWPGRWQRLELDGRTLILDATHNAEGSLALEENIRALIQDYGDRPWIIAGTLGDERASALMPVVAKWAKGIVLVRPNQPRACSFEELERALPTDFTGPVRRARTEELFPDEGKLVLGKSGEVVVVTGSIYLVGEILSKLRGYSPSSDLNALQDWV